MTKINVSTHFSALFTQTVRAYLEEEPAVVDSRRYVRTARDAVAVEAARLLSLVALRTTSTVAA
jgi:fructose-bisphosphate aldolase class II